MSQGLFHSLPQHIGTCQANWDIAPETTTLVCLRCRARHAIKKEELTALLNIKATLALQAGAAASAADGDTQHALLIDGSATGTLYALGKAHPPDVITIGRATYYRMNISVSDKESLQVVRYHTIYRHEALALEEAFEKLLVFYALQGRSTEQP